MKRLYVVFLSTPYRIGKMIRVVTGHAFNHVALSLTADLDELYSFARPYRDLPLCGRFVIETPERYLWEKDETRVRICAIPMTPLQEKKLRATLAYFTEHADETVYNHFAALLEPVGKTVHIRGAYTCAQFAQGVLGRYFPETGVDPVSFLSLTQLADALAPYSVYEGPFPDREEKCRFDYYTVHGTSEKIRNTMKTALTLFHRL